VTALSVIDGEEGRPVRFVWRIADMMVPWWPGLVERQCSRCSAAVYMDSGQVLPLDARNAVLICVPCGLNDPEYRPELFRMHAAVRATVKKMRKKNKRR
jgi:hypothetical protein